jgi:intracellular sulfur oxidation DsrE/DsrF family protein
MQSHHELDPLTLNAFVDRQLDPEQERGVLAAMEADPAIRDEVSRLRKAKDWMRTGFADAQSRAATATTGPRRRARIGFGIAASLIALTFAAGGGLIGFICGERQVPQLSLHGDPQHILLHLDESAPETFSAVLDYAEKFLAEHQASGAEVEVVANASGIDLMRVGGSPYEERVRSLSRRYQNLHFIACANAIRNLRTQGVPVTVLDKVSAGETAVDHIVRRLHDGWSYVKVNDLPGI